MKIFSLSCLLCWYVAFTAIAQESYVDSLKRMYSQPMPDSVKAEHYNRIFFHYIFFNADSAYRYANLSFEASKRVNYKKGFAKYYNNVGILNRVEGDYAEAIQNILHALKINEEIGYELGVGNNYVNIGLVYATERKHHLALDYYHKGLLIKQKYKDTIGTAYCLRDMGDAYMELGNYEEATTYYEKVINTPKRLGLVYRAMMSLGIVYHKQGKKEQAVQHILNSLEGLQKHEIFELALAYNALGKIKEEDKQYAEAIEYYQKASIVAQKYKNRFQLKEAYKNLANTYKLQQNITLGYEYLQRYTAIQDSLFNIESSEKIHKLQKSYALNKKQNEIEIMNKDKALHEEQDKKQFMFTKGVLVLAVLAMVLLFVVYANERRTRKANKTLHSQKNELFEKNEEINQQKEEIQALNENLGAKIKERTQELDSVVNELHQKNKGLSEFSYIVAHNIRAPVASIKGLLSLLDYGLLSPDHLEILLHIQKTIENFEMVVDDLDEILEIRDTQQLKLETVYLKDITDHTLNKFKNEIRRNRTKIIIDFEDEPRLNTNKDYLSDILYHLLSNAIKYQSTNRALEVFIGSMSEDDYIVVEVRDNGVGIDLSKTEATKIFGMHQRMHTHVEGKGFGLYLVKNMIEALHGKITVESEVDKGSCFKLYFPQSI